MTQTRVENSKLKRCIIVLGITNKKVSGLHLKEDMWNWEIRRNVLYGTTWNYNWNFKKARLRSIKDIRIGNIPKKYKRMETGENQEKKNGWMTLRASGKWVFGGGNV